MKFLDQAKIYIKAGNGGSGSAVSEGRNLLNMVDQMAVMVNTLIDFIMSHNMGNLAVKKIKLELMVKFNFKSSIRHSSIWRGYNNLIYDFTKIMKSISLHLGKGDCATDLKVPQIELLEKKKAWEEFDMVAIKSNCWRWNYR